ncbi:MAG: uroporphyrinogen-III synthase [Alphaproteobacteria bacterium]|nr:uroporphyrinogen-III synthase [Alphaproteobacteria bacterium]
MIPLVPGATILVTRPQHDAQRLAEALAQRGYHALLAPVMEIVFEAEQPARFHEDLSVAQALVLTSANGARASAKLGAPPHLTVFAVGDATAETARGLGFADVHSAAGDVTDLARLIAAQCAPEHGCLVHAAGSATAGDLMRSLAAHDLELRRHVIYRSRLVERLEENAIRALAAHQVAGAVFFSPRTARAFMRLADQAQALSPLGVMTALCLSPAVEESVGPTHWGRVLTASTPNQAALLSMLPGTCQTPARGSRNQ